MAVKPVVHDDTTNKHRPLGSGEKMDGLSASSIISAQSGNLITTGSDGLAYATGSGIADPAADNLIEATSGGKLKVDMDRIIEWLDGHPNDAKILSEAIKVVSGDSGNVITKGSDKGAYLSSASLANVIAGMSAAQLQQLASALADGKTIVASGGKLTVDPTSATAAQLTKISAAIRKSGGGLSVGSDGKLSVDFASMDPAIMRAVVLSMVQDGGGLAVDSNGQLYVDFTTMPDDKFQQLKDSLDMQRTLNSALYVYVDYDDAAASDTYKVRDSTGTLVVDVDRGKEDKPFKTVQGAVNMVTRLYALGANNAYIYVKARRARTGKDSYYSQNVTLPGFTATTGVIHVMAYDNANRPKLRNGSVAGNCVIVNGGTWYLHHLDCFEEVRDNASATGNTYPTCIAATADAEVHLRAVHASTQYYGTHPGKAGTFEITPLSAKPQRVVIGSAVVFDAGAFPGWPANEERPIITDANGTTTFISCTWTAPTSTASGKLTIRYTFDAASEVTSATYPVTVDGTAQSSGMSISVASLETTYSISMRVLTCSLNGAMHLDIDADGQNSIHGEVGNASYLEGFELTRGGYMQLSTGNTPPSGAYGSTIYAIPVSGNFRLFASVSSTSQMIVFGGGLYKPYFYPVGTVTGRRYAIQSAGGILAPRHTSVSEGEALPGDVAGTVEDFTYSWYKENEYSNN